MFEIFKVDVTAAVMFHVFAYTEIYFIVGVRDILGCVSHMELLDPEIVPSLKACTDNHTDQAAIENLRLLKNEWCSNMDHMMDALDSLTDPNMFIAISGKCS